MSGLLLLQLLLSVAFGNSFGVDNAAGFFTKQSLCDPDGENCRDSLIGQIRLGTSESATLQTLRMNDNDAGGLPDSLKGVGMKLKIEKSPLLIIYGLQYEKEVIGGLSEEVFTYPWSAAGSSSVFEFPDFEPSRCRGKREAEEGIEKLIGRNFDDGISGQDPEYLMPLLMGGRVCGCRDTGWGAGSYSHVQRSSLNCNAWPAVFRPSSTTWASRHCAKLNGPAFVVYNILSWRWEFQIHVFIEWFRELPGIVNAKQIHKEYILNYTHPEAYDNDLDFHIRIAMSGSQSGMIPPDLGDRHFVLIPKLDTISLNRTKALDIEAPLLRGLMKSMDDNLLALNELRSQSLILPRELVDLSGNSCDKVGTSLFKWAQDGRTPNWVGSQKFCEGIAGECLRNQPNDFLRKDQELLARGKNPKYLMSRRVLDPWSTEGPVIFTGGVRNLLPGPWREPLGQSAETKGHKIDSLENVLGMAWPTAIPHQTQLEIWLNVSNVAFMIGSAKGSLLQTDVHSVDRTKSVGIRCYVRNDDTFDSIFKVTAECSSILDDEATHQHPDDEAEELEISPASMAVKANEIAILLIGVHRKATTRVVSYQCRVLLSNTKGMVLGDQSLTIQFQNKPTQVSTLDEPEMSERNVTEAVITGAVILRGQQASPGQFSESSCNCNLVDVFCFFGSLIECTLWIRRALSLAMGCFLVLAVAAAFGPCLITCCCKTGVTGVRLFRRRIQAINVAAKSAKASASAHSTAANTPVHAVAANQNSAERLRASLFMRDSLLNTKGRDLYRQYQAQSWQESDEQERPRASTRIQRANTRWERSSRRSAEYLDRPRTRTSRACHRSIGSAPQIRPSTNRVPVVPEGRPGSRMKPVPESRCASAKPAGKYRQGNCSESDFFADAERMTSICSSVGPPVVRVTPHAVKKLTGHELSRKRALQRVSKQAGSVQWPVSFESADEIPTHGSQIADLLVKKARRIAPGSPASRGRVNALGSRLTSKVSETALPTTANTLNRGSITSSTSSA